MNGIYPFGGSDPGSSNSVINSPFGPTVGPAPVTEAVSPTYAASHSLPDSPTSSSSSSSGSSSLDSNATAKGPRLLFKSEKAVLLEKIPNPPLPKAGIFDISNPIPKTNHGKPFEWSGIPSSSVNTESSAFSVNKSEYDRFFQENNPFEL